MDHPTTPAPGADEWLLADGAGGFAMGPGEGPPTRRYHAWLIAAAAPPLRRRVLWRGAAEWWEDAGADADADVGVGPGPGPGPGAERYDATCFQFAAAGDEGPEPPTGPRPGPFALAPDGRRVTWSTRLPVAEVSRHLELAEGAARMQWTVTATPAGTADSAGRWCVRPFTPLAPFHGLSREGDPVPTIEAFEGGLRLRTDELEVDLTIEAESGAMAVEPEWWRRFALEHERARGQDWIADEWSPGVLRVPLVAGRPIRCSIAVALRTPWSASAPAAPTRTEPSRHSGTSEPATVTGAAPERALARLAAAAEAFVVRRGTGRSIIAGYPWFADWGRDALISLPGLLPPGEGDDEAVDVLAAIAAHRRDGLLPNCFHDESGANFHAADTGPWFLRTVAAYAAVPGGLERVEGRGLFDAAADIVEAVVAGTRHGIRLDDDGLVTAGEPGGPAVTWMDAMRGGVMFTPRHGKAVEVNALWIEGLTRLAEVEPTAARRTRYVALAASAVRGFAAFRWPERDCLVDRLARRDETDPSAPIDQPVHELRPNQLIAAACPAVPLSRGQRAGIVAACRAHLLTPFGMRTLEPDDPAYVGRYEGDLMQRDAAYHQGTVWPWLIGPFVDAMLLSAEPDQRPAVARQALADLQPLLDTLDEGCHGHLAEIYDGDEPRRAEGCPAQAWSAAEVRRVLRRGLEAAGAG